MDYFGSLCIVTFAGTPRCLRLSNKMLIFRKTVRSYIRSPSEMRTQFTHNFRYREKKLLKGEMTCYQNITLNFSLFFLFFENIKIEVKKFRKLFFLGKKCLVKPGRKLLPHGENFPPRQTLFIVFFRHASDLDAMFWRARARENEVRRFSGLASKKLKKKCDKICSTRPEDFILNIH